MSLKKSLNVLGIIQARLTSERFPNKILSKIGGKEILIHCIENTLKARLLSQVVVASPHPLLVILTVPLFIGSEQDVLGRFYECAKKYKADTVVRLTADCPFLDPLIIDLAVVYFFTHNLPYIYFAPVDGLDVEVFSMEILKEAHKNCTNPQDREHVTPYMRRKTKISIDTTQDLERARDYYDLGR